MSRFAHAAAKNLNIKSREPERHSDEPTKPAARLVKVEDQDVGDLERLYVKGYDDEPTS